MSVFFKASEVEQAGTKGTYTTEHGGVGLGYRMMGEVVSSGGNGFFYPVDGLRSFAADGGAGYMARVRRLALPPACKGSPKSPKVVARYVDRILGKVEITE
jgi:hypothetical protein